MERRRRKPGLPSTVADAVVVALSPALIIGMVACLIFFLVTAFYRGQYDQRLLYILGLFTVATVLIARIAIESGRAYANAFSVPLAIVSIIAMLRFVTFTGPLGPISPVVNVALLALAWYLADRITFDCTEVDERDSGVQQGLLQSLGLLPNDSSPKRDRENRQSDKLQTEGPAEKKRARKKHNPGVWVLYFAVLAFPLFGLGQLVIPDSEQRQMAFYFLVGYLGCALGLLSTTSFVSTRRYLRHRGVSMPADMSRHWLGYGALGILLVLFGCLLLPLPGRSLGLVGLPFGIESPEGLRPSKWGWGKEGNEPTGQDSKPKSEQNSPSTPDRASDPNDPSQSSSDEEQSSANASSQEKSSEEKSSQGKPSQEKSSQEKSSQGKSSQGKPSQEESSEEKSSQEESSQEKSSQEKSSQEESSQENSSQGAPDDDADSGEASQSETPESQSVPPSSSPSSSSLFNWIPTGLSQLVRWLTIVILVLIIVFYVVTHPGELLRLWHELLSFLTRLLGWGRDRQAPTAEDTKRVTAEERREQRPFRSFANPFAGNLQGWTPEQVVEQTFAALEAWGAEHGRRRAADETAIEFARQLGRREPGVQPHAALSARMLDEVMFAGWHPTAADIAPLEGVWQALAR